MPVEAQQAETEFANGMKEEFEKIRKNIKKPIVLVLGATGCGKSSLVNLVFGENVAEVGAGKPVTKGIERFESDTYCLFDSEGYELGSENQSRYKSEILSFIEKFDDQSNLVDRPHLAWYCISYASHRITDTDIEILRNLKQVGIPVCVVFTQADRVSQEESDEMIVTLENFQLGINHFEVSTEILDLTPDPLIEWSYQNLDEAVAQAFAASVRGGIPLKWKESRKIIAQHALTAATAGASPVPFSDSVLLSGNQLTMMARLLSVWNLNNLEGLVKSSVVTTLTTTIGRTLAGNLLKFIPGAGTVVGGAINAGIASSITYTIGYAISEIAERVTIASLEGREINIETFFAYKEIADAIYKNYKRPNTEK